MYIYIYDYIYDFIYIHIHIHPIKSTLILNMFHSWICHYFNALIVLQYHHIVHHHQKPLSPSSSLRECQAFSEKARLIVAKAAGCKGRDVSVRFGARVVGVETLANGGSKHQFLEAMLSLNWD